MFALSFCLCDLLTFACFVHSLYNHYTLYVYSYVLQFTADVNVSQDERRNCVVEERDGGEGDETVVVEVVSTPQPTTDEDEDTLRSQESNDTLSDGVGRSEIAHPVVPTPNTTQLSSVEGPPSFTVSDHPCEETAEKRE